MPRRASRHPLISCSRFARRTKFQVWPKKSSKTTGWGRSTLLISLRSQVSLLNLMEEAGTATAASRIWGQCAIWTRCCSSFTTCQLCDTACLPQMTASQTMSSSMKAKMSMITSCINWWICMASSCSQIASITTQRRSASASSNLMASQQMSESRKMLKSSSTSVSIGWRYSSKTPARSTSWKMFLEVRPARCCDAKTAAIWDKPLKISIISQ